MCATLAENTHLETLKTQSSLPGNIVFFCPVPVLKDKWIVACTQRHNIQMNRNPSVFFMFSPTLDVRQLMLCLFAINLLNAAADMNTKKQQIFFFKKAFGSTVTTKEIMHLI